MTEKATRRAFVAGLVALGLLPVAVDDADGRRVDARVERDDIGTTRAAVESGSSVYGAVEIGEYVDDGADISVTGYNYDDERGEIEVKVAVGATDVTLCSSPERARGLADELRTAAQYAESNGGER